MRNSPLNVKTALILGIATLVASSAACSRGELSAAERQKSDQAALATDSDAAASPTAVGADSGALFDPAPPQAQTKAPASIEDILKASPLRNAKANCATPVSGNAKPAEVGIQCPTDPPAQK